MLGYNVTSFAHQYLAIMCHSSPHLFTSQALSGWMGTDTHFKVSPKYLIGFKSRLWLDHSRTFNELSISPYCCVLRVIVLLEAEPCAQSEVLSALDLVFIKAISIYLSQILSMDFHPVATGGRSSVTLTLTLHFTPSRTTVPIIHCTDYSHTAASNQTHFIILGLPLSDSRVMFAFISLIAIATLRRLSVFSEFSLVCPVYFYLFHPCLDSSL